MKSPTPVKTEERSRSHGERMEQQAYLTRLGGGAALPLTLVAQRAGAATADAGRIHHAQAPISLSAPLVGAQGLPGWAAQRAIRLKDKVATREAACFPGQSFCNRSIALYRGRGGGLLLQLGSKLGCAHRSRAELMAQLQTEVPHPLVDDLPCLLTPGCMTTPTIRVLLHVFIRQGSFEGATMQVECYDISRGEGALGKMRQEEFIDNPGAGDTDSTLGCPGRMSRDDNAAPLACFAQELVWTVVERAADSTFRMRQVLVRRQVQAGLDFRSIQYSIVFAACDIREPCQIGDDRPGSILPIQAQDGMFFGKAVCLDVASDHCYCAAQFLSILAVAGVAKAGQPLMCVRVEHRGACADDLPTLAAGVARRTQGA